jgi:hypothetical protein
MDYGATIKDSYYTFSPDVPKERVTLGVPVLTTDHALIHEGIAYTVSGTFAAATTSAAIGLYAPAAAKASATVAMTDTDANLIYTAVKEGKAGNSWSVVHEDPSALLSPLDVSVAGNVITVSLETDAAGAIVSTSAEVADAVNANPEIAQYISCAEASTGGVVNAVVSASLTGGANQVVVHFKPLNITAAAAVVTTQIHKDRGFTGTAVSPMWEAINSNDLSSNTSDVIITSSADATLATAGAGSKVVLTKTARGHSGGPVVAPASVGSAEERVFKPGLHYTIFMARAASTAIDFELFWYEEVTG